MMRYWCRISRRRLNARVADWMRPFVDITWANYEAPRLSIDIQEDGALLLTSHKQPVELMIASPIHSRESVLSNSLFHWMSSSVLLRPHVSFSC